MRNLRLRKNLMELERTEKSTSQNRHWMLMSIGEAELERLQLTWKIRPSIFNFLVVEKRKRFSEVTLAVCSRFTLYSQKVCSILCVLLVLVLRKSETQSPGETRPGGRGRLPQQPLWRQRGVMAGPLLLV